MALPMQTHADNLKTIAPADGAYAADDLADRLLQMTQALQTTLDLPSLLDLFCQQAGSSVPLDGLEYENARLDLEHRLGEHARNVARYTLKLGDLDLGNLAFRRRTKFGEEETVVLEKLLCCLLYPLRNALLYRDALALARKDALTGICNRSAFDDALRAEVNLARRHDTSLSLILFDIDHFKRINDQYGHTQGDNAIRAVVRCAQQCARNTDMLFRYGGEEFVMVLRNTSMEGAHLLADRIRRKVEKLECQGERKPVVMTISAGVACLTDQESAEQLFERADRALYAAKHAGRNRVQMAE